MAQPSDKPIVTAWGGPIPTRAVHFVGFRGDEYHRARRVFGAPDFIHLSWDRRARREIADGDVVLFAKGEHDQAPGRFNSPDLIEHGDDCGIPQQPLLPRDVERRT